MQANAVRPGSNASAPRPSATGCPYRAAEARIRCIRSAVTGMMAAVLLLLPLSAGASEGACPGTDGVTVVVDFGSLGGGVAIRCAPGAPGSGSEALTQAGFSITMVQSQPGFICRIDGKPDAQAESCSTTPPADAFWSYWHAERGGAWTESSHGATLWRPPAGSVEGWAFADSGGSSPPSADAPAPPTTTTTTTTPPSTTTTRATTTTRPATTTTREATTTTKRETTTSLVPITEPTPDTTDTSEPTVTSTSTTSTTSLPPTTEPFVDTTTSTSTALVGASPPLDGGGGDPLTTIMGVVAILGLASGAGWLALRRRDAANAGPPLDPP